MKKKHGGSLKFSKNLKEAEMALISGSFQDLKTQFIAGFGFFGCHDKAKRLEHFQARHYRRQLQR
jgi:hypothetical protein